MNRGGSLIEVSNMQKISFNRELLPLYVRNSLGHSWIWGSTSKWGKWPIAALTVIVSYGRPRVIGAYLIEFNSSFQFKFRKRRRRRSPTNNNTIGNARYFYFAHFSNVTMSVIYYKWFFNRNGILNGQVIQPSNYNCLRCLWFRPSMDGSIYGRRLGEDNYIIIE